MFIPRFACKCSAKVKEKNQLAGHQKFSGFALNTKSGRVWYCHGRTEVEIKNYKDTDQNACSADHYFDACNDEDELCVGMTGKGSEFGYVFTAEPTNAGEFICIHIIELKSVHHLVTNFYELSLFAYEN